MVTSFDETLSGMDTSIQYEWAEVDSWLKCRVEASQTQFLIEPFHRMFSLDNHAIQYPHALIERVSVRRSTLKNKIGLFQINEHIGLENHLLVALVV